MLKGIVRRLPLWVSALLLLAGVACGQVLVREDEIPSRPAAGEGILRQLGSDPPTMDPALAGDTTSASYIVEIFGGLVKLNEKLEVVPDIAKSWQVSPDGKTYTFQLRDDVKFHSGRPVTAQDFKFSLERTADPKTESHTADTYLGDIVGAMDMIKGRAREIRGVQVVDDKTLRITMDAPKVYFLAKLTYPTAYVVDKDNVAQRNWTDRPNGTGPFKLTEWKKGERIVLERNEQFYDGLAKLKRVEYLLAGGSAMTMYENNEIDISGIGLTDIDRVLDPSSPLNKQLHTGNSLDVFYMGFNVAIPPFDDVKVRQAFNHAVDKERINRVVLRNLNLVAKGVLPPGMPGYNENLKGLEFNPTKAKQLLAESKYKDAKGLGRIVLTIGVTGASLPSSTEAILNQWKENLGVEIEVQQMEWAVFLQEIRKNRFQLYQLGWIADYADPENFLDVLFHPDLKQGHTLYDNPRVNKLLEDARVEADVAKRLKLYQQAEQIVVDEAPWLPLWHSKNYLLIKPYVKGYTLTPTIIPFLKNVFVGQ